MADTVLVSSCLLGLATRYDGTDNFSSAVSEYLREQNLIPVPVCPEQLAGMPTPRPKCWFTKGDGNAVLAGSGQICDEKGLDVTAAFSKAAAETCKIAELTNSQLAILKQRSPSCGSKQIYRNGQLVSGLGATAASLKMAGLRVLSEEDFSKKTP